MEAGLKELLEKYSSVEPTLFTNYLKLRKRDPEEYPPMLKDKLEKGYVLVASEDAIERMIYAKTFREFGMSTFIVEEPKDNKDGLIAIAPLQNDLEAILWLLTGYHIEETMPADIIKTLAKWRDYCSFRVEGAGLDWVKLDFETLPTDTLKFAAIILDFCPSLKNSIGKEAVISEHLLSERKITLKWKYSF